MNRKFLGQPLVWALIELVLILIGVVIIFIGAAVKHHDVLTAVLVSVGTAAMVSGFVTILHNGLGLDPTTSVTEQLERLLKFSRSVYDNGIDTVQLNAGDTTIYDRFPQAHSIDMMHSTGKVVGNFHGNKIEQAIAKKGCVVRVLLANPEGPVWQNRVLREGLCPGTNIAAESQDAVTQIAQIVQNLDERLSAIHRGSLEVRRYSTVPTCNLVIVDDREVRVTPYLPYHKSNDVASFDVSNERRSDLFAKYRKTFDLVWGHSEHDVVLRHDFSRQDSPTETPPQLLTNFTPRKAQTPDEG